MDAVSHFNTICSLLSRCVSSASPTLQVLTPYDCFRTIHVRSLREHDKPASCMAVTMSLFTQERRSHPFLCIAGFQKPRTQFNHTAYAIVIPFPRQLALVSYQLFITQPNSQRARRISLHLCSLTTTGCRLVWPRTSISGLTRGTYEFREGKTGRRG